MSPQTWSALLIVAALLAGGLATWADARGHRWLHWITKPLATALILVLALLRADVRPQTGVWIVIGLAFSLAGDVLLMLESDRFVAGLASFLLAQVCYIIGLSQDTPGVGAAWAVVPSIAVLALMARRVMPQAGSMRVPVLIYGLVIATMAWRAAARYGYLEEPRALIGMIGGWLFCASDLSLAWQRFVRKAAWLPVFCLATYYGAQLLITLSI